MGSHYSYLLETAVLLALALLVFERTRHLVIYGFRERDVFLIAASIATFVLIGTLVNSGHLSKSRSAMAESTGSISAPPVLRPSASPENRERVAKNHAQFVFVQSGDVLDYTTATGERISYAPTRDDIQERASKLAAIRTQQNAGETARVAALFWWFAWIPMLLLGYASGRGEYATLRRDHKFGRKDKPQTFGDVEGFVGLLMSACEQTETNKTLEVILSLSDEKRQAMLRALIAEMREKQAPKELIDAFLCLMDDDVAEKVYVYIHKCARPQMGAFALR